MVSQLNPYLNFDGSARQAMEFYRDVFGGELTINTFGESGMSDESIADQVMHSQLETEQGYTLMASDTAPGTTLQPGNTVTVSLSGDDDRLRDYWTQLSDGGTVSVPFEKQMWGDEFGMCVDRFGVSWMVNRTSPQT